MDGLSMEAVARDRDCFFRRLHSFVALEIVQQSARLRISMREITKCTLGKKLV
jgi:hypothetical protein